MPRTASKGAHWKSTKQHQLMISAAFEREKRDHSRNAAKSRRSSESGIFNELVECLPSIESKTIYQLDRMAVLRLILTYCRLRQVVDGYFLSALGTSASKEVLCAAKSVAAKVSKSDSSDTNNSTEADGWLREAAGEGAVGECIDGFVMVVSNSGQLLFVSTSVAECVGFTQADLIGRFLRDYVDIDDWPNLKSHLCAGNDEEIFFRMKTALTARGGRARKLTVAVFEPLRAYITKPPSNPTSSSPRRTSTTTTTTTAKKSKSPRSLQVDEDIRLVHCLPFALSSTRRALASVTQEICTRHEMDMRFRNCDESFAKALNLDNPKPLYGQSFFTLVHPEDTKMVAEAVARMHLHSHSTTGYYRMLTQGDGYRWVSTEMQLLVQNIRGVFQKSVVCSHQFVSNDQPSDADAPLSPTITAVTPSTAVEATTPPAPSTPPKLVITKTSMGLSKMLTSTPKLTPTNPPKLLLTKTSMDLTKIMAATPKLSPTTPPKLVLTKTSMDLAQLVPSTPTQSSELGSADESSMECRAPAFEVSDTDFAINTTQRNSDTSLSELNECDLDVMLTDLEWKTTGSKNGSKASLGGGEARNGSSGAMSIGSNNSNPNFDPIDAPTPIMHPVSSDDRLEAESFDEIFAGSLIAKKMNAPGDHNADLENRMPKGLGARQTKVIFKGGWQSQM